MTKTLTNAKALEMAMACEEVKANKELFEKLFHMHETMTSKTKKETPKQRENKAIAEAIKNHFMENPTPLTAGEVMETVNLSFCNEPMNIQRISRICTNMKEEGVLKRLVERKVALFTIA